MEAQLPLVHSWDAIIKAPRKVKAPRDAIIRAQENQGSKISTGKEGASRAHRGRRSQASEHSD